MSYFSNFTSLNLISLAFYYLNLFRYFRSKKVVSAASFNRLSEINHLQFAKFAVAVDLAYWHLSLIVFATVTIMKIILQN